MTYLATCQRYRVHRLRCRELLEEELLHAYRRRIKVVEVDDDVLREARRDWYMRPERRVQWDWEEGIIEPGRRSSARYFDFAVIDGGALCVLAAARVSHKKRWLSLTHVEGAPWDHALKGEVLPLVVRALYVYRATICVSEDLKSLGIRVLNPLPDALESYRRHSYTRIQTSKRLSAITLEDPAPAQKVDAPNGTEAQGSQFAPAEDGSVPSGRAG